MARLPFAPRECLSVVEECGLDDPRCLDVILRVYLSNNNLTIAEVPITPETTCRDVVDCCKEPGEVNCHLAEHWRGSERPVGDDEKPFDILQQWGIHRDEVKFYLRHEGNMPTANGGEQGSRQPKKKNGVKEASPESQVSQVKLEAVIRFLPQQGKDWSGHFCDSSTLIFNSLVLLVPWNTWVKTRESSQGSALH
ncbi:PPP1R13B [Branchiostoma lanceolatum]|uniref:PPP1R13B protein n=1 Tax=Branchiostoma lanceolatum TaxID=7740 RepID=A0A8J9ZT71_BRALA|nr:PPP1R13B [Branchiostoma lanceolatum]